MQINIFVPMVTISSIGVWTVKRFTQNSLQTILTTTFSFLKKTSSYIVEKLRN